MRKNDRVKRMIPFRLDWKHIGFMVILCFGFVLRAYPQEVFEDTLLKDIHFDADSFDIRPQDAEILKENAALLMKYPNVKVQIEGYGDERGSVEYNLALAERRANSTKKYLISFGISEDRLFTISGVGGDKPAYSGHNEKAWTKNRRVHFVVVDFDIKKPHDESLSPIKRSGYEYQAERVEQMIKVSGMLKRVFGIGGETAGWAIDLDSDLEVPDAMKKVKRIEVEPNGKTLDPLEGHRVEVVGSLTWRHGVERGDYPVIVINAIKEIGEKK